MTGYDFGDVILVPFPFTDQSTSKRRPGVVVSSDAYQHPMANSEVKPMRYKIALQHSGEGFSVSVPGLPGCWSQGDTEAEALQNIQEAIADYLAVVDELLEDAEVREVDVTL